MKFTKTLQIFILAIIVIAAASIFWPQNFVSRSIINTGVFLVNPMKRFSGNTISNFKNFFSTLRDIRKLAQINKNLELENRKLIKENSRFKEVENENKILRSQLSFSQSREKSKLLPATVIGRDPSNLLQYMTIDRGAKEGIKKDMPVISEGYLVGKIAEVSPKSAKVFLITNPSSIVNAMVQESRSTGLVKGALGYGLTIEAISQEAKVKTGDLVITSGLGGTYPKGLVIGEIDQLSERQAEVFKKASVKPLIDFTSLEIIFVIIN